MPETRAMAKARGARPRKPRPDRDTIPMMIYLDADTYAAVGRLKAREAARRGGNPDRMGNAAVCAAIMAADRAAGG